MYEGDARREGLWGEQPRKSLKKMIVKIALIVAFALYFSAFAKYSEPVKVYDFGVHGDIDVVFTKYTEDEEE